MPPPALVALGVVELRKLRRRNRRRALLDGCTEDEHHADIVRLHDLRAVAP